MEELFVLNFYKYVNIENAKDLAEILRKFCKSESIRGSILLSHEGINASVSGSRSKIDAFKKFLLKDAKFGEIFFKEDKIFEHPFEKIKVKVKKEIVSFNFPVELKNVGRHISAEEFSDLYDSEKNLKENVVVLDARNNYEYEVGRFKDAIHLDLDFFREFPKKISQIENKKNKKIVMYCTGGIRCEKASAYLKSNGFADVSQLNQGIIQFCKESSDSIWEGKCFVFDKRMVSDINSGETPISFCKTCKKECDFQRNCRNVDCDLLYISCLNCEKKLSGCCNEECMKKFKKLREKKKVKR